MQVRYAGGEEGVPVQVVIVGSGEGYAVGYRASLGACVMTRGTAKSISCELFDSFSVRWLISRGPQELGEEP